MDHLKNYQVGQHPVHYVPNFISEDEETLLLRKIDEAPASRWRNLSNRRLQVWGGELTKSGALIPQELPAFITTFPDILEKLRETGVFSSTSQGSANHIILNEYLPGQGITPHQDGPAYHPVVATLSLGSHTVMEYYRYQKSTDDDTKDDSGKAIDPVPVLRLLLEPRSLIITHGTLYTEHLHGITGVDVDIFVNSDHTSSSTHQGHREENSQVIEARDISNSILLGEPVLRKEFTRLSQTTAESNVDRQPPETFLRLERHTRTSLTCRVVEKTAHALGKLAKLR